MKIRSVIASVDHCRIEHNDNGILIQETQAIIRDSVVASNAGVGVAVVGLGPTDGGLENYVVTHNGIGIEVTGPFSTPHFYVSATMVVSKVTGLQPNGGHLISFANNRVASNGTKGVFTDTIQQQ